MIPSQLQSRVYRSGLILLLILTLSQPISATSESVAERITPQVTWSYNGVDLPLSAIDGAITTRLIPDQDSSITIKSTSANLCTVYFEFDALPEAFHITTPTQSILTQLSFIHQAVFLEEPVSTLTIDLPATPLVNIDVYTCGTLPSTVEQWEKPLEKADLLVVPTHFDDESLFFGGAIVTAINQGKRVQVSFLTHHQGYRLRQHEVLKALWVLGIRHYPDMGILPDRYAQDLQQALTLFDEATILDYQVMLIRKYRPEVVVGHDLDGEYGHGVHRLNALLLVEAFTRAWDPTLDPTSYLQYGPYAPLKLYLHLYPQRRIYLEVFAPLEAFGGRTAMEVSVEAFDQHQSQQWTLFTVITHSYGDIRFYGLRRSLIRVNDQADLFEGVTTLNRRAVDIALSRVAFQ